MEEAEQLVGVSDPLLICCLCKRLLRGAVQLRCLHNCCQLCFSLAASIGCSQDVACSLCDVNSRTGTEQPNSFVDRQVLRYTLIDESRACGICNGHGESDDPNLLWCPICRHWLCTGCNVEHKQFNREHVTQSLEEPKNLEALISPSSSSVCSIHKKPVDVACLNCEQTKCISCAAECHEKNHITHVAGSESCDKYVADVISRICSMESELSRKSEILGKPQKYLQDMKTARKCHLAQIKQRKRLILDAVEVAYDAIVLETNKAYDKLEDDGDAEVKASARVASSLSFATNYVQRLLESDDKSEILNQQKIVQERLSVLSTEVDSLSEKLAMMSWALSLDQSLPDDLENVLRQWIGLPVSSSTFGAASASVELPVNCYDVALTQDGRLLLAAWRHGLLEFSSSSAQELSRWQPPKQSKGRDLSRLLS